MDKPIIIFGPPRSGTTWFAEVLASNMEFDYVNEPDNEKISYHGFFLKDQLPRFPYIVDEMSSYEFLNIFKYINDGNFCQNKYINKVFFIANSLNENIIEKGLKEGRNQVKSKKVNKFFLKILCKNNSNSKRKLIKSVHSILSIPELIGIIDFVPIVVLRHPCSVIASQLRIGNLDIDRKIYMDKRIKDSILKDFEYDIAELSNEFEFMGLQMSIFHHQLENSISNFNLQFYKHEDLCVNSEDQFRSIFEINNIQWNSNVEEYLKSHNKPGDGYNTNRIAKDQIDKWKRELSKEQIDSILKGYSILSTKFYL